MMSSIFPISINQFEKEQFQSGFCNGPLFFYDFRVQSRNYKTEKISVHILKITSLKVKVISQTYFRFIIYEKIKTTQLFV